MVGFVRRVVTGHNAQGRSVVLSDGLTPTLKTHPLRPGHHSAYETNHYYSACMPASLTNSA